jgi:hypothetical protein
MNQRLQSRKKWTIYFPVLAKRYPVMRIMIRIPYKYTITCNKLYQFNDPPLTPYTIYYDKRHLENIS